jgi:uncharacterized protein (TIGR03435 family)
MKQLLLLAALTGALLAQGLAGTWQGTLSPPNQNREIRVVMKITKDEKGHQGTLFNIDQGGRMNLGAITLQGNTAKISVPGLGAEYEGKLDSDEAAINGTMTQGTTPMPLLLKRATPATAWEIPPPPAPPKPMAEGTKLEFEVATIKPTPEGQQGNGINVNGRQFRTRNTSLTQLLTFAFKLHRKQVSGLPGWAETEHFDIQAPLPGEGAPNEVQLRTMMQNLIKDRFGLTYHKEKRELSVYAINVGKGGPTGIKMVKNDSQGTLPGFGSQGPGGLRARNATMSDFASFLQFRVLDRPVIDQSGVTDRFDFQLNFKPDEFQYPDAPAGQRSAAPAGGADARADLFTAFQEQLGMKLEATKAPADVMVIDKVAKPSEN